MVSWLRNFFGGGTAIDPVCGMEVSKKAPGGGFFTYSGETHYFCAPGCRADFEEDPEGYLSGRKKGGM